VIEGYTTMKIEVYCTLEEVKRFLIESTCKNKLPPKYAGDKRYLFERRQEVGKVYVEAEYKRDVEEIEDITVIEVQNVLGITYRSRSGRTNLIWRQIYGELGKLEGEASGNTIVNLLEAGIRNIRVVKEDRK